MMIDLKKELTKAVKYFWQVRDNQQINQGGKTGIKDAGNRSAVTGGRQLNGFINLIEKVLIDAGVEKPSIYIKNAILPGYFRPTKDWDLIVKTDKALIAVIEFKSQVGSFGNNFNNRVEEALGNATDILTAYREGKFAPSQKPWIGYFMLLERHKNSISPVKVSEPHYIVFEEFRNSSYAKRYELFCQKLLRERLYDSTCFILSDRILGQKGKYFEPNEELSFENFISSLIAKAISITKSKNK